MSFKNTVILLSLLFGTTVCFSSDYYNVGIGYDMPTGDFAGNEEDLVLHGLNVRGSYMFEIEDNIYLGGSGDVTLFYYDYTDGTGSSTTNIGGIRRIGIGPTATYQFELGKTFSINPTLSPLIYLIEAESFFGTEIAGFGFGADISLPMRFSTSRRFSLGFVPYYKYLNEDSQIFYENESSLGLVLEFNFKI